MVVSFEGFIGILLGIGSIIYIKESAAKACECLGTLFVEFIKSLNRLFDSFRITLAILDNFGDVGNLSFHILLCHGTGAESYHQSGNC